MSLRFKHSVLFKIQTNSDLFRIQTKKQMPPESQFGSVTNKNKFYILKKLLFSKSHLQELVFK